MPENNGQQNNQQNDQQGNQGAGGETPAATWETVLAALPEEQQGLYNQHVQGLRTALQSERDQHQDLARQLREATQRLEEGSETRQQLEQLTGQIEVANQRADFFEQATQPEIGCSSPRLAWLAAQEVEAFDRRGNVNWAVLKEQFPELFGQATKKQPPGNAGSGTSTPPAAQGMNAFIRRQAGRG